jgi:AraC-like DNA-binding protein
LINKGGIHSSPGTQRLPLFRRIVVHFTDPDIIDTPNNDIHASLFEHTSGGGKLFPSALCKGFPWEHYLRQIVDADDLHTQRLYLSTLLREMSMHYPNLSQKREAKGTADEIISYINTNSQFTRDDAYNNALSVKSICDKFHISPPHLNHITESLVGTTAMKYIMRNRMNRAQYLLQTGRPPSHVYNIVGFSDYSGFYRAYLRHFGHSPSVDYIKK